MSQTGKSDIIRAIFAAYLANDRKRVDNALTDDFHFTSPYDDNIDKPTYFERCWKNTDWIARHELEKIRRGRRGVRDLSVHRPRRQAVSQY
jgi:ketosteroid isomerase-like protein